MGRKPKLSVETKVSVCKQYLDGKKGAIELSYEYDINASTIYSWVNKYQSIGTSAFNLKLHNTSYTKKFKQQVVEAYLNGEGSMEHVANRYDIPSHKTLYQWIKKYNNLEELKDYDPKPEVYMKDRIRKTTLEERIEIVNYCLEHDKDYKGTAELFDVSYMQVYQWVRKYLASVVPVGDNFYAALNSAVFSDGSFCYIPKGVRCPMELSSYFRINASGTGQFERTLIVADEGSYVSYLEGCTAPMRDENQLHAAVVEIVVEKDADVKYSTVQNWYPGDAQGRGGIFNFVTKRGICKGEGSHLSWTQVETGSAITWKYPSTILKGDNSSSEFYSVAVTNNMQQADTGTKMIHIGRNTRSRIISKGISAGHSQNSYRGLVRIEPKASNSRNYSQCDSLLIGDKCGAHTFPHIVNANSSSVVEHEATTSKISEEQLFYCNQRGIGPEDAVGLIVNGYAQEVLAKLPMEFAVEARKLLQVSLEGSVG